jgi:hypothetical protein
MIEEKVGIRIIFDFKGTVAIHVYTAYAKSKIISITLKIILIYNCIYIHEFLYFNVIINIIFYLPCFNNVNFTSLVSII